MQIAHLQKKVEKLRGEVAALEASVRDAQGQAVALTQKLALSEGRNADLNKCYEVRRGGEEETQGVGLVIAAWMEAWTSVLRW